MSEPRGVPGLDVLTGVEKPARYVGGEWNEIRKDPGSAAVKVALAFPDVYEIAMSYLGQKILYSVLNRDKNTAAERVFTPWPDYEQALRRTGRNLCSLENGRPLKDFDIVGFSLLYELNYSNVLTMLDLGGIPFLSSERDLSHPLVIAGGPAAFNPEPLADIFDLFLVGDGEEAFPEIVGLYQKLKGAVGDRAELLRGFAGVPGVYVPSLYEVRKQSSSPLVYPVPAVDGAPAMVRKRALSSFRDAHFPEEIIVPNLKVVFDRVAVEATRGCPQNCRFCQASSLYFPAREKDPALLYGTLIRSLRQTGYENASLSSLSIGDYSCLEWLIRAFMAEMAGDKVSLSLSSLRPRMLSRGIVAELLKVRKTGFTLVPEAGTERLRAVINKNLTDADIGDALRYAFEGGWRLVKYYFMIGLPTETAEDLEGIISLVADSLDLGRRMLGRPPGLNISLASFIPKPHTPFQWLAMEDESALREKQELLKRELRRFRSVEVKEHDLETSVLEAVFSRGDRRLGPVLIRAWRKGTRFDGWSGHMLRDAWREAFAEEGLDPREYLGPIDGAAVLPWDHIAAGLERGHLAADLVRALKGERSPACGDRDCRDCLGCEPRFRPLKMSRPGKTGELAALAAPPVRRTGRPSEYMNRYRAVYSKCGKIRLVSHIDLIHIVHRGFRRAGLALRNTEGFHPQPDLSYGPALPLGMEGLEEVLEFKSASDIGEGEFLEAVNASLPQGMRFSHLEKLAPGSPSLQNSIEALIYSLDPAEALGQAGDPGALDREAADRLSAKIVAWLAARPGAAAIGPAVMDGRIRLTFPPLPRKGSRPQDLLGEVLGLENVAYLIRRDAVVMKKPAISPASLAPV